MSITMKWADVSGIKRFDNALKSLGDKKMKQVLNRAVNRTGDTSRTIVKRTLAKQTGLQQKVIHKALKVRRSSWGRLEYRMLTRGGDISLKYFKARETRKGVSAAPFGKRQVFANSFMKAGKFPRRIIVGKLKGHVFTPASSLKKWGRPMERVKSGVIIPREMVQGDTASAFDEASAKTLPKRVAHEINRLTGGVIS